MEIGRNSPAGERATSAMVGPIDMCMSPWFEPSTHSRCCRKVVALLPWHSFSRAFVTSADRVSLAPREMHSSPTLKFLKGYIMGVPRWELC